MCRNIWYVWHHAAGPYSHSSTQLFISWHLLAAYVFVYYPGVNLVNWICKLESLPENDKHLFHCNGNRSILIQLWFHTLVGPLITQLRYSLIYCYFLLIYTPLVFPLNFQWRHSFVSISQLTASHSYIPRIFTVSPHTVALYRYDQSSGCTFIHYNSCICFELCFCFIFVATALFAFIR